MWLEQNNINVKNREIAVNPCEEKYFVSSQKEAGGLEESWWKQRARRTFGIWPQWRKDNTKALSWRQVSCPSGHGEPARDATFSLQASA